MTSNETLRTLDELIRDRSILRHPFYLAWQRGELTRHHLATYACVYYPHVAAFPGYLRNAMQCAPDAAATRVLQDNLEDELTNPAPHPELWLDFAEAMGANRQTVAASLPLENTARTVSTFNRLTSRDTISGLAALYSYESQQPAVALEKMRGLQSYYGITQDKALAYFAVHATTDVAHCAAERTLLAQRLQAGGSLECALDATEESLDAYWSLLDGVTDQAGLECLGNT